jgi:hypothetical protein
MVIEYKVPQGRTRTEKNVTKFDGFSLLVSQNCLVVHDGRGEEIDRLYKTCMFLQPSSVGVCGSHSFLHFCVFKHLDD